MTAQADPDVVFEAMRAGAVGFLLTGCTREELARAVRLAVDGESLVDSLLATQLLRRLAAEIRVTLQPPEPLTAREIEVLQLLSRGETNRQIAASLFVAVGTVKSHVEHILGKLGVADRTDAAVRAVELGLVRDQPGEAAPAVLPTKPST